MKKLSTKDYVLLSLLLGLNIFLSRFLSISAWNTKISFSFLTLFVSGYFYGPIGGALIGGFGDLIGALAFPIGEYFPGFTLTAILKGILFGAMLTKNKELTLPRIIITCLINEFVFSLVVNSFWVHVLYNSDYLAMLATRSIQCVIMSITEIVTISLFSKSLPLLERRLNG